MNTVISISYLYYAITITITITVGGINSRMPSYLKIFVLIDFPFEDAIFPFNRGTAVMDDWIRRGDADREGTHGAKTSPS